MDKVAGGHTAAGSTTPVTTPDPWGQQSTPGREAYGAPGSTAAGDRNVPYERVNVDDVDPVAEGMHFLRDPLGCDRLGVTVLEVDSGWTGKAHDHADDDHEEVYLLLSGEASIEVDDERVELDPGDAVRVAPQSTRRLEVGDAASRLVIAGAP